MSEVQIVEQLNTRKVTIKALRFNAETDYLPYTKEYDDGSR